MVIPWQSSHTDPSRSFSHSARVGQAASSVSVEEERSNTGIKHKQRVLLGGRDATCCSRGTARQAAAYLRGPHQNLRVASDCADAIDTFCLTVFVARQYSALVIFGYDKGSWSSTRAHSSTNALRFRIVGWATATTTAHLQEYSYMTISPQLNELNTKVSHLRCPCL